MGKEIEKSEKLKCGIVMPIAAHPDYPPNHWSDVLEIIKQAVEETGFEPSLVSESLEVGLIQERIVNNLYSNEIVICDVSSKNPNVMFELGLRLAFDKPTIIIKDDLTNYSFDIGPIEHLPYPASLRFSEIIFFKENLIKRINASYAKSVEDKDYSPFLKSFGTKIVPKNIKQKEITESDFIIRALSKLQADVSSLRNERTDKTYNNELLEKVLIDEIKDFVKLTGKNIENEDDLRVIQIHVENITNIRVRLDSINEMAKIKGFSNLRSVDNSLYDLETGLRSGIVSVGYKNGKKSW